MARSRILVLCATLLLAAAAFPAAATTAIQLSDEDLVQAADLIVVGRCAEVQSTWVGRDLVTLATVEVREQLKGAARPTVTVVLPGGVDTHAAVPVAVTWPGAPNMAPGEEVFLFLNEFPSVADGYAVAGFSQGKFSVVEGPTGEPVVSRSLGALTLRGGSGESSGGEHVGGERSERLSSFLDRVRSILAAGEVQR